MRWDTKLSSLSSVTGSNISASKGSVLDKGKSRQIKPKVGKCSEMVRNDVESTSIIFKEWILKPQVRPFQGILPDKFLNLVRASIWASPSPCSRIELETRVSFLSGLDIIKMPENLDSGFRQYVKLGCWTLKDICSITITVMQPDIATMSVEYDKDLVGLVSQWISHIDIVSQSTSRSNKASAFRFSTSGRAVGRLIPTVTQIMEADNIEFKPIFINMSHSSLLFTLKYKDKLYTCRPTSETLNLFYSHGKMRDLLTRGDGSLSVYQWNKFNRNCTHLTLSQNGEISILGSVEIVEDVVSNFKELIYSSMRSVHNITMLIDTSQVVE
ncbi:uncharacterized protein EV154DRAFT_560091 [Mucor mucedo]|uniref:uncharacterized protein n=1 Tax=Mucor mucedo TaxID=29922 RepID=UPI00221F21AC|nr:uncharacterized protein EV154DRAFT_560091 [Mucor mucedo]KAI7894723.1 hypothetical protein EV154DRAFT_560091 [Mucor mucedo]